MFFRSEQLCALQSSKMVLGPVLAGFDESNTPLSSSSFYLPTKALTDGCLTVIRHCNCTCLMCVNTQTHMHTFKCIFSAYIYGPWERRVQRERDWVPIGLENVLSWPKRTLNKALEVFENKWNVCFRSNKTKIAELFYIYDTALKCLMARQSTSQSC